MSSHRRKHSVSPFWFIFITLGLYYLYFELGSPMDYASCDLCDKHEYKKLYDYFEHGIISQIKFPYYMRPFVPWLAALVPGNDMVMAFHVINFVFILLSIYLTHHLWRLCRIPKVLQWIALAWLLLHWTGILRFNLMDYVTVDVPLYAFHTLAMILFIRHRYQWLYVLAPIALLQKESFSAVLVVFMIVTIFRYWDGQWYVQALPLLGALVFGLVVQKAVLMIQPDQLDQRNSFLTLLYHLKLVVYDPTRLIRWFAAFGSAFGLIPVLAIIRFKWEQYQFKKSMTMGLLSIMFVAFGLTAGEDMTRIMFLGFPFIMTLSLIIIAHEHPLIILVSFALSIPFMRVFPIVIDIDWAVDYAPLPYVLAWSAYYLVAILVLLWLVKLVDRRQAQATGSATVQP